MLSNSTSSACKHRVSGSISLPSRGTFHLSLTVLYAIGHQVVFSLGGWSPLLPTRFLVSGGTLVPAMRPSPSNTRLLLCFVRLSNRLLLDMSDHLCRPATPNVRRLSVWALSRSLAATQEIIRYFLFLRLLRCFSSPGSPRTTMDSSHVDSPLRLPGFPIRKYVGQSLFAAHHSLSQLVTSFFGS